MGGSTLSTSETKIEALRLQSSAYGATIPLLGGMNRIPGNLIWYGDFKATPHTSTESAGGKGGGIKTQNTTFTYSASVLMGICQGPVGAIARVWKGKEVFAGGWGPSQVLAASETYTVPGSGAMTYTLAHGATLIGTPVLNWEMTDTIWQGGMDVAVTVAVPLASGVDFAVAGSVLTVLSDAWRGRTLSISYQYGSGSPDLSPLTTLGITLANGDMAQAAPAWLTSAHPSEALAYPGLAYVHAQDYSLGTGASVDNHSFEVQGSGAYRYGSTLPDCNPAEFSADVLVNGRYGARLPAATLDVAPWVAYCAASGLLMSPLLTEQVRAADYIDQICKYTNSAPVWSVDRLRIVPYGDVAITGNGVTYTPDTTPLYDLDDDRWLQEGNDDPLHWQVKEPSERYNHVRVEFADRAIGYSTNIAEAKDDADIAANGLRTMATVSAPWICDAAVAGLVARIIMQRSLNITGTGTLRLPWAYCLLECMDLLTLTDAALGFAKEPVRITAIGEDEDGMLEVEVEDWPLGSASPTRYPGQLASGFAHDFNAAPGSVDTPVIFEAPAELTATGIEVYAAVRGSSAQWGGCQVWVSLDGTTYKRAGVLHGGARYGTLSAAAAGGASSIAVQGLGAGQLIGGSAADAAALATLCYVGGAAPEYLAYQTATLTGAGAYTLGSLVHAAYGTAAAAHASGAPFVRVDDALAMSGPLDASYVGKTLSFKFCSFNVYGGAQQALDDVSAYTYTVTGAMAAISVPIGSKVYRQPADPAASAFVPGGAVWFDSDDNNAEYLRANGAWVSTRDGTIAIAKSVADAAASDATAALAKLTNIASDSILSPGEKPAVVLDYAVITSEQSGIDAQATAYAITTEKTAYDTAVTALTTYLGTLSGWNTIPGSDVAIVGSTFRAKFSDVYMTRQTLLNAIYSTAKISVDAAALAASDAAIAAADAQSDATAALTSLINIASDSLLTPDEKPRVIMDRDVIVAEQASIDAQATNYAVTTEKTTYDTAVTALTTYLATLTTAVQWDNLSGNTTIVGATFRAKFADVYISRQALQDKIAANAKARLGALATLSAVDTAQIAAGAVTTVVEVSSGFASAAAINSLYGITPHPTGLWGVCGFSLSESTTVAITIGLVTGYSGGYTGTLLAISQMYVDNLSTPARESTFQQDATGTYDFKLPVTLSAVLTLAAGNHIVGAFADGISAVGPPYYINCEPIGNVVTKVEIIKR